MRTKHEQVKQICVNRFIKLFYLGPWGTFNIQGEITKQIETEGSTVCFL